MDLDDPYSIPVDRFVCAECISDPTLSAAVRNAQGADICSYCGADGATDLSAILELIADAIATYYNDPAGKLLCDSTEGGYQGQLLDASHVLMELGAWTNNGELFEDVRKAFGTESWCRRDYYGLTEYEALQFGWSAFCEQVKYRTRYLFLQEVEREFGANPREIPPGEMLDALGELFLDFKLFAELPAESVLIRARVIHSRERPSTAAELGTAPRDAAILPNRMSPAGISMFYAALDEQTAVAETFDPAETRRRRIALARFVITRSLVLLDLTTLPSIPSPFDAAARGKREAIRFLHSFEQDLTRRVKRDGRAHTEYVPTQVVTEFVRHRLKTSEQAKIDGILYRSSRHQNSKAVVIFAEPSDCGPRDGESRANQWYLRLTSVRYAQSAEFILA